MFSYLICYFVLSLILVIIIIITYFVLGTLELKKSVRETEKLLATNTIFMMGIQVKNDLNFFTEPQILKRTKLTDNRKCFLKHFLTYRQQKTLLKN